MKLYIIFEYLNCADLVIAPHWLKPSSSYTCRPTTFNSKGRYQNLRHNGSSSPKYIEVAISNLVPRVSNLAATWSSKGTRPSHFTLFYRGRERNVQRFKTHVHSLLLFFCLVTLSSPSPSRFAKLPVMCSKDQQNRIEIKKPKRHDLHQKSPF